MGFWTNEPVNFEHSEVQEFISPEKVEPSDLLHTFSPFTEEINSLVSVQTKVTFSERILGSIKPMSLKASRHLTRIKAKRAPRVKV